MSFPKEGDTDNEVAEFVKSIPYFENLTIYEVNMILMSFFSNFFHLTSSLSRLIDVNPLENMKANNKRFGQKTFRTHYLCEFIKQRAFPDPPAPPVEAPLPI
jgi:hypothetical protein